MHLPESRQVYAAFWLCQEGGLLLGFPGTESDIFPLTKNLPMHYNLIETCSVTA